MQRPDVSSFLSSCWTKVSEMKESLPQLKEQVAQQVGGYLAEWVPSLAGQCEEVQLGARRLRILKTLGEGGYSFVYLAQEVPPAGAPGPGGSHGSGAPPQLFAVKTVLAAGPEQLAEARHEVDVMRLLRHPNLLPLIDFAVAPVPPRPGKAATQAVHMLFPLYSLNLWDAVQRRCAAGAPLSTAEVLHAFMQLCLALEAMHAAHPALAHRDVKPHNILLRPKAAGGAAPLQTRPSRSSGLHPPHASQDAAHLVASSQPLAGPAHIQSGAPWLGGWAASGRGGSDELPPLGACEAVLMDFGSTAPARVEVTTRREAVALQEDAERLCTAPYRAPELWDVPSCCTVDERVDVWAAGCVLYFLMVGESPFERSANEAGGSLLLAVVNGQYTWPEASRRLYPQGLRDLAASCLTLDPAQRPFVGDIKATTEALLREM